MARAKQRLGRRAERLTKAGVKPCVGNVGNRDDHALAEIINGLCKTEVILHREPWEAVGVPDTLAHAHRQLTPP